MPRASAAKIASRSSRSEAHTPLRLIKKVRNKRVRVVEQQEWARGRMELFASSVKIAAAAKAWRTSQGVTQIEVANEYACNTSTVCHWESGKYAWTGGKAELDEYIERVRKIAQTPLD